MNMSQTCGMIYQNTLIIFIIRSGYTRELDIAHPLNMSN